MLKQLVLNFIIPFILVTNIGVAAGQGESTEQPVTVGAEKRGFEWLGYGYKGYEFYASNRSKTSYPIYDMQNVNALYDDIGESTLVLLAETSKREYYDKRFANLKATGTYELYTATVTANFDDSVLRNYNYTIGTGLRVRQSYRLTVPDGTPLDTTFSRELMSMEPVALFDKFGTHALRSFIVGGRYEASSYLEDNRTENKSDSKSSLKGGLKLVFDVEADGGTNSKEVEQLIKDRTVIKSYGGGMEQAYEQWFKNLNDNNSQIAEFEKDSLIPLYELVQDNPSRQAELKIAYEKYMDDNAEKVMLEPDPTPGPGPVALTPLKYGDPFRLQIKTKDNVIYWVSANSKEFSQNPLIPGGIGPREYFPKLRKANGVKLYFLGAKKGVEVNPEKLVTIATTEKSVGKYNFLSRYTLDVRVYYYLKGYDEQKWVVTVKNSAGGDDRRLFYGDEVEISMYKWPDYTLCKFGEYLSTTGWTKINCHESQWTIVK